MEAIDYLFHPEQGDEEMPRLVLLDLSLPRLDGFGVLKKIRQVERTKFIPVVMLTASNHPDDVRRAYELGANGYLDKLSNGMRWDEMVRAAARYWVRMNLTPYSLGTGRWLRPPDLRRCRDSFSGPRPSEMWTNALAQSFVSALKAELTSRLKFPDKAGARKKKLPSHLFKIFLELAFKSLGKKTSP